MADKNTSGAVHLTSLDVDISSLKNTFAQVNELAENLGRTVPQKFFSAMSQAEKVNFVESLGIKQGADTAVKTLDELAKKIGEFSKIQVTVKDGNLFSAIITSADSAGTQIRKVIDLTENLKTAISSPQKITYTEDLKKLSDSAERTKKALESLSDAQKNIDLLIYSYKELLNTTESSNISGNVSRSFSNSIKSSIESLNQLKNSLSSADTLPKGIESQIKAIEREYERLSSTIISEKSKTLEASKKIADEEYNAHLRSAQKQEEAARKLTESEKRAIDERAKNLKSTEDQINALLKAYGDLNSQVLGSNLSDKGKSYFVGIISEAQSRLADFKISLETGFDIPPNARQEIEKLGALLGTVKGKFEDARTASTQFNQISSSIENVRAELEKINKEAQNKNVQKQAKELSESYKELYNRIKSGNISVENAKKEFDKLGKSFSNVRAHANDARGGIAGFLDRLADRAKWMISYRLISMIRTAFNNVIGTIKETEDSVVKLQRVLNDESISSVQIQEQLFGIASQYGQTFENVREAATLFTQTGQSWEEVLDSVHATMLGLNTAEITVQQATEGLIAVMSQFGLEANELEDIINKISITADSFPVTSEKIITALQRMGATASTMGLSLEESIALITELSKTTGRSGANIGTALNSLLQYTQKASSLKIFAGLSDKMDELVNKFKAGSVSILDVWKGLAQEINSLSEQQQAALFSSEEYSEFADKLESEASEYADSIKSIYGTAGTYRQTYFIAALKDIETVDEAIENMADSTGYAAERNELYMETLTARWNDLVIAAKELAVQFGNEGFLDFLKVLTGITAGVFRVTKAFGGLNTVILSLSSLFLMVKRQRINDYFSTLGTSTNSLTRAMQAYNIAIANGATKTKALQIAVSSLHLGISGFISVGLVAVTVVYSLASAYKYLKEEQKAAREELVSNIDETKSSALQFMELKDAYDNATEGTDEFNDAQKELLEYLGYQESNISVLENRYGSLKKAIEELTESEKEYLIVQAMKEHKAAEDSFADIEFENANKLAKSSDKATKALNELVKAGFASVSSLGKEGNIKYFIEGLEKIPKSSEDAKKTIEELDKYIEVLKSSLTSEELSGNELYIYFVELKKKLSDLIKKSDEAESSFLRLQGALLKVHGETENAIHSMDRFDDALVDTLGDIEALSKKFDELSGAVDNFQSAYSTIIDVIDEYNESGQMTADNLQKLLELDPEYLEIIEEKNGALTINNEKLNDLIDANDEYLIKLAAVKLQEDATRWAQDLRALSTEGLTRAEIEAKLSTIALDGAIAQAMYNMATGAGDADSLRVAVEAAGKAAGLSGDAFAIFSDKVLGASNSYINFIKETGVYGKRSRNGNVSSRIGTYYTPTVSSKKSSSSSKTAAEKFEEQIKSLDEAFDDMIDSYEHTIYIMEKENAPVEKIIEVYDKIQKAIEAQLEKYRKMGVDENSKYIRDLETQWWELQEEIEDVYDGIYEKSVSTHENAIKMLERQYSVLEENGSKLVGESISSASSIISEEWASAINEYKNALKEIDGRKIVPLEDFEKSSRALERLTEIANAAGYTVTDFLNKYSSGATQTSTQFSGLASNLKRQGEELRKIMDLAYKEIERLIKSGKDINDDAVQDIIDDWWDAYDNFKEINEKIVESTTDSYDNFISLADAFDIWDQLDFTKFDYLKKEMQDINSLYQQGIISLKEYKSLIESVGTSLFEAQKESLEKKGEDREKYYDKLKEEYELEKENLSNRKDEISAYYDEQIKLYEEQIEQYEKQKDASDKYYDGLIENLQKVEEENDRVNAQLDYYAERQKILTNLEQAQSRSGLEWREKEREYQQNLIDLDSNWNRTLEEWNLTDQIENLEKLKEAAAEEFESIINQLREYIDLLSEESENALEGIEDDIEIIDEKIKQAEKDLETELEDISKEIEDWKVKIYNAITDGSLGGAENAKNALGSVLTDFENLLSDAANGNIEVTATNAASSAAKSWEENFKNPVISQIESIGSSIQSGMVSSARQAATSMSKEFETNFLHPTRNEIHRLMNDLTKLQNTSRLLNEQMVATKIQQTTNTANIYANIANTAAANATAKIVASQFMTNPSKAKRRA